MGGQLAFDSKLEKMAPGAVGRRTITGGRKKGLEMILPETLPDLLRQAASQYASNPAIVTKDRTVTYAQLQEDVASLARGLIAAGVGKGTRVALLGGSTPFWIKTLFACARVGALAIPISTIATPSELAYILRHSDAEMLLAGRWFVSRDYGEVVLKALPALAEKDASHPFRLTDAPYLRSIWFDDATDLPWARSAEDMLALGRADPCLDDAFLDDLSSEVHPSDDAVVIYTSGSTARPKAVLHGHGGMARQARVLADHRSPTTGARVLTILPMFWVGGLNILLEAFVAGSCVVLPDGVSMQAVADALQQHRVDVFSGWPAQAMALRELLDARGVDYSGTRNLRFEKRADGSFIAPDLIPNSLGMTESFGPHCACSVGTVLPEHRRGAFGPAIGGVEQRVVDPESGAILPAGMVGELQIRGGALMKGYYKKEAWEAFTADGFFATNDLVQIEPDGFLYFKGRLGDMLKTKGANVSRLEVEAALRECAGVAQVVVCGLPDPILGDRVVAAVAPAAGATLNEAALKAELSEKIAGYKVPADIVILGEDEFLWSPSGKIRVGDMGKLIASRLEVDA